MPDPQNKPSIPEQDTREDVKTPSSWADDQEKHRYYYDDAHGYEKYDPDKDEEECEE